MQEEETQSYNNIPLNNSNKQVINENEVTNCNKSSMFDLEEFDQLLSKYRDNRGSANYLQLDAIKSENVFEISIGIAENDNKTTSFQGTFEETLTKRTTTENCSLDITSISTDSEESIKIYETDQSVELDDISLDIDNFFANFEQNESKNIEIEIDMSQPRSPGCPNFNLNANDLENEVIDNFTKDNELDTINIDDDKSNSSFISSDFEFISEEEAKKDGFIVHFKGNDNVDLDYNNSNNENFIEMYLPNGVSEGDHHIPEGEEFYNLFRDYPAMLPNIFLENKAVIPIQCMSVEKEALGFDMRLLDKDNFVDDEHQEEANETANKIMETYECNKRRRSRRLL